MICYIWRGFPDTGKFSGTRSDLILAGNDFELVKVVCICASLKKRGFTPLDAGAVINVDLSQEKNWHSAAKYHFNKQFCCAWFKRWQNCTQYWRLLNKVTELQIFTDNNNRVLDQLFSRFSFKKTPSFTGCKYSSHKILEQSHPKLCSIFNQIWKTEIIRHKC